jgi:hypothetical protein
LSAVGSECVRLGITVCRFIRLTVPNRSGGLRCAFWGFLSKAKSGNQHVLTCWQQAKFLLAWFRDRPDLWRLGQGFGIS